MVYCNLEQVCNKTFCRHNIIKKKHGFIRVSSLLVSVIYKLKSAGVGDWSTMHIQMLILCICLWSSGSYNLTLCGCPESWLKLKRRKLNVREHMPEKHNVDEKMLGGGKTTTFFLAAHKKNTVLWPDVHGFGLLWICGL